MKEESEPLMSAPALHHHRWTREQYERMVDIGIFEPDDALELLDGHIVDMSRQGSRHAAVVGVVAKRLAAAFPDACQVREEKPIALGDWSEPQPDIAVVRGGDWDFLDAHPDTAELVVEVSETSLAKDRGIKSSIYARSGIPEYWIMDLGTGTLEVCRDPQGNEYGSRSVLRPGDVVHPLGAPDRPVAVRDLLPPR